jgi:FkbM family methyltransferase
MTGRDEPLVSYAQHGEDVVLQRAFAGQAHGRYVDVGSFDPTTDSVTRMFYDRGWRGVNIEPDPSAAAAFERDRPDDVNMTVAAGDTDGSATLFVSDVPGWSTTDPTAGAALRAGGHVTAEHPVAVRRLSSILDELPDAPVDFLKIDAEGAEPAVVAGLDLSRHRPRVVVLESVAPGMAAGYSAEALDRLQQAGYTLAGFDGLNHYLTCEPDLVEALARPANPTDRYVKHTVRELELRVDRLVGEAEQASWLRTQYAELSTLLSEREATVQRLEAELDAALKDRDAVHDRHVSSQAELAAMRGSSSWRLTAPLRLLRHGPRAGGRAALVASVDRALLQRPGLRQRVIELVERHPRTADDLRRALAAGRFGTTATGPSHDSVAERRALAVAALDRRARLRADGTR